MGNGVNETNQTVNQSAKFIEMKNQTEKMRKQGAENSARAAEMKYEKEWQGESIFARPPLKQRIVEYDGKLDNLNQVPEFNPLKDYLAKQPLSQLNMTQRNPSQPILSQVKRPQSQQPEPKQQPQ